MRGKTAFAIGIFTAISVLVSLSLPKLTSKWQDWKSGSQVEICETEEIRLPYSNQVIDSLRLFSGGYQYAEISGGTVHTEEEIEEKAAELLDLVADRYGFPLLQKTEEYYQVTRCECFLAVSTETGIIEDEGDRYSAIIWDLDIEDAQGGQVNLCFDDTSGKMISFSWHFMKMEEESQTYEIWYWVEQLIESQICDFFCDYYNLDSAEEAFDSPQGAYDTYMHYVFSEEKYGVSVLPVRIMWDRLIFNPGVRYTEEQ